MGRVTRLVTIIMAITAVLTVQTAFAGPAAGPALVRYVVNSDVYGPPVFTRLKAIGKVRLKSGANTLASSRHKPDQC